VILLAAVLSFWSSDWYEAYSRLDWAEMDSVAAGYTRDAGQLAEAAIAAYGAGEGDPLALAKEAVDMDPGDFRGWTALALVEMREDSLFMDSLFSQAFSRCAEPDPVLLEIYAYWMLSILDFDSAVEHASLALEADPSFGPAWLTLSMAYMDMGSPELAMEASMASMEVQPESPALVHQCAMAMEAVGHADQAEEAYSRVIAMDPSRITAYADLGLLYEATKRRGQALKVYRDLLEVAPEYAWAWGQIGSLQHDLGRTHLADSSFSRAIDLNPGDPWPYYRLGRLRSAADPGSARELLEAAVELDPGYSSAWQELAFVYETLDMMPAAASALERCIEIAPEAWLMGELGYVNEVMGEYDEAAAAFQGSVDMDDQYLYGWQRRGEVFLVQGDSLAAAEWYRLALGTLNRDDPWISSRLGTLMAAAGEPDSAVIFFRRATELDPGSPDNWLNLSRALSSSASEENPVFPLDSALARGGDSLAVTAERILILDGRGEDTGPLLEEALSRWPDIWVRGGWSAFQSGFYSRALAMADRALISPPDDLWAVISLGELFGELGDDDAMSLCYSLASESPLRTPDHTVSIANHYFRIEDYSVSIELLLEEYSRDTANQQVATALAEAYLFDDRLDEAEEVLLRVIEDDPFSVYSICYLGLIEENRGNPQGAASRYLEALRLEPGYSYAEDRLLFISGEDYDPHRRRAMNRKIDWSLWLNLSSTGGNTEERYYGGGGNISWNYGGGSSLSFEANGTVEIKDDRDLRRTAWTSLSAEHFLTSHLYGGASTSWDRQPLTVRPWQVSSYLAAGWKSWPSDWIWVAPEAGAGLVNTRWSTEEDRTDEWTVYGSVSVWAMTKVDWLPSLWLSGSVYLPPADTSDLVASGVAELEFTLPGPLSLVSGVSLDYTRTPVVETWEHLDSEVYLRLRL